MSIRTTVEHNAREVSLRYPRVASLLPDYFPKHYPNLVNFLESYYEQSAANDTLDHTFNQKLFAIRDLDEISLDYIDSLFYEIGNGASSDYFQDPRFVGKLLPLLLRSKGTELGIQLFFRTFFGFSPEIQYPKLDMLEVFSGDSDETNKARIGVDDGKVLQNSAKYQKLSVLIRSEASFLDWENLYRKFVHSAGYFLSSEVVTEGVANANPLASVYLNDLDSSEYGVLTFGELVEPVGDQLSQSEVYIILESDNTEFHLSTVDTLDKYSTVPISYMDTHYDGPYAAADLNSPRVDQDSDGTTKIIETSTTLELVDASLVDSA